MKKITQFFFDNLSVKIFSVLAAIGVWFFVVIANKPEINFVVPLKFQNIPQHMEISQEEDYEIDVKVRADQSLLNRLSARQIKIAVDLNNAALGKNVYNITASQIISPVGIQISKIIPDKVEVNLEPLTQRMVPVEPIVLGVPAEGYELKEVAVFPKNVLVIGAKSRVAALKAIDTSSFNITGFNKSVTQKLKLSPLPNRLRFANDTSLVEARAIIGERAENRQFEVPVGFNPIQWRAEIDPASVKVTVSGPISRIRALKAEELSAFINLFEIKSGQTQLEVKVKTPDDIYLVSKEPASVKVISIEKFGNDDFQRPVIRN